MPDTLTPTEPNCTLCGDTQEVEIVDIDGDTSNYGCPVCIELEMKQQLRVRIAAILDHISEIEEVFGLES